MKKREIKRTRNITVFAVITITLAVVLTILSILMYLHPRTSKTYTGGDWFLRILPILYLVCGVGILRLKNWARRGIIILAVVYLILFIPATGIILYIMLKSHKIPSFVELGITSGIILFIVYNGLIVWFFNQDPVKKQFQRAAKN